MPQKRNGSGGMQNYVPAGNGDASGEYGDNATGSNKHFQSFKKPESNNGETKETSVSVIKEKSDPIKYNQKNQYTEKEITNIIKESMGASRITLNVKRVVEQLNGENINPEIKNLVIDILATGNYKVVAVGGGDGYYQHNTGEIHFASANEGVSYANGQTLCHEVGHALDYSFEGGWGAYIYSKDYVSKKYGKSMLQMKRKELGEFLENGGYEKIMQEYNKDKEEMGQQEEKLKNELDKTEEEYNKIYNDYHNEIQENPEYKKAKAEQDKILEQYTKKEINYEQYAKLGEPSNNIMRSIADSANEKYHLREKLENLSTIRQNYWKTKRENSGKLNRKWMDLSDMCQAIDNKYKFNGGHDLYYFGTNGKNEATECFAEIQSAIGANKDSLQVLERYIPKTIEIYREIIGGLI